MADILPPAINNLIEALSRLPGVGPKSASRMAFHLLQRGKDDIQGLTQAIAGITDSLQHCSSCGLITDQLICVVCQDERRNPDQICVVEDSLDVVAFERAGVYKGYYHVLGGVLSPIEGIGPDQLRIAPLIEKLRSKKDSTEIILAMNPSLEGEATADYLKEQLDPLGDKVTVTRIARGLPMGSDVEFADPTTLIRALEGRREL